MFFRTHSTSLLAVLNVNNGRMLKITLFIIKVLYMSNNNVKDWGEFQKLAELHQLEDLLFVGELC